MPNTTDWRDKPYLTIKDIQHILGICYTKAFELSRTLPRVNVGPRCTRIPTEAFKTWLSKNTMKGVAQ